MPEYLFGYRARLSIAMGLLAYCCQTFAVDLPEEQIKAGYLYNFAKFTEWPSTTLPSAADIQVCLLGSGLVIDAMDALDGKSTGEHHLHIQHIAREQQASNCQVLFISQSEQARFQVALQAVKNMPILTVSDIENFAEAGGAIGFLVRDSKVKFEVNLETVRNSTLHLPGQLLNIAYHVYGE